MQLKKIDKKARGGTNMLLVGGVIGVFAIVGILMYIAFFRGTSLSVIGGGGGDTGSTGCAQNPSIVTAVTDELVPGTAVTDVPYYRLNGAYTGTTAPTTKGTADILFTSAGYIAKIKPNVQITCGSNLVTGTQAALANATMTVYSNNGLSVLSGAATYSYNETAASAGGSLTWQIHLVGVSQKSTGNQLLIVETPWAANISSLSLSGGSRANVPNGYSRQISNSYADAWLLPKIDNGAVVDYYLTIQQAATKSLHGVVYMTLYNVQPFVETDGTFNAADAVEKRLAFDSQNTAKYASVQTYNPTID